jgi:Acetyltransferase (GNAT) family
VIIERALVERLEATGAATTVALARALAATSPSTGAVAEPLAEGALIATGPGRYVNRAIGVSLADVSPGELVDRVVEFFRGRQLRPSIELCAWAPAGLLDELGRRGFTPEWFRNAYVRTAAATVDVDVPPPAPMVVREVDDASVGRWQQVLADGNGIVDPAARAISDEFVVAAHAIVEETPYLVEIEGEAVGCGSLRCIDGVGWVGAAATVAEFGQRGVQGVLLRHRIAAAAEAGCDVVAATALPGGRSARNLERHGFVQAYAQLVMTTPA